MKCLAKMLKMQPILVGSGTDGAPVNIAQHSSIKQELQATLPWLYWFMIEEFMLFSSVTKWSLRRSFIFLLHHSTQEPNSIVVDAVLDVPHASVRGATVDYVNQWGPNSQF